MTTRTYKDEQTKPRPGERIQEFWCDDCKEWHRGSVLGGPVEHKSDPLPLEHQPLKSLSEVQSERDAEAA